MPKNDNEQLVVKPSKWKNFKDTYFLVGSIDIPFLGLTIALLTIGLIMLFYSPAYFCSWRPCGNVFLFKT